MNSKMIAVKNACPFMLTFAQRWRFDLEGRLECEAITARLLALLDSSSSTPDIESARAWMAVDWMSREFAPAFLALTPSLNVHAEKLRALVKIADENSADKARESLDKAESAAWAAARNAAWSGEQASVGDAWDASWAVAGAATVAERAAAGDAAWAALWTETGAAARDVTGGAARVAAWSAAGDALNHAVEYCQASALALLSRMAALGDKAPSARSIFFDGFEDEVKKISPEERAAFLEYEELREFVPANPLLKVSGPWL